MEIRSNRPNFLMCLWRGLALLALVAGGSTGLAADAVRHDVAPARLRTLSVEIPASVTVRRGDHALVSVWAEAAVIDRIVVDADATGAVRIHALHSLTTNAPIRIEVSSGPLEQISMGGAGTLAADGVYAPRFTLQVDGAAGVKLSGMNLERFTVHAQGAGSVVASGTASEQVLDFSGAANYTGDALKTGATTVRISGTGEASVWANQRLDVDIAGMGTVRYHGSAVVHQSIAGLGSVEKLEP